MHVTSYLYVALILSHEALILANWSGSVETQCILASFATAADDAIPCSSPKVFDMEIGWLPHFSLRHDPVILR